MPVDQAVKLMNQGCYKDRGGGRTSRGDTPGPATRPGGPRPFPRAGLPLTLVFTVYPVLRTFYNSVHLVGPQNRTTFIGLRNFGDVLTADPVFWKAVSNTAIFSVVRTIADVAGGLSPTLCLLPFAPHGPAG